MPAWSNINHPGIIVIAALLFEPKKELFEVLVCVSNRYKAWKEPREILICCKSHLEIFDILSFFFKILVFIIS